MKKLIWKELTEQRYIPLAYGALLCTILLVWEIMGNYIAIQGGNASDRMNLNNALGILCGGLLLAGLLPGSNTVAAEASQGTLTFLFTMPVSRGKLWFSKIAAGTLIMFVSALAMILVFFVFSRVAFHGQVYAAISQIMPSHSSLGMTAILLLYGVLVFLVVAMGSYSVSLFCSNVTDRPLAAAGLAICIGMGLLFVRTSLKPAYDLLLEPDLAALVFGFLVASWVGFRAGSGTTVAKRRTVSIVAFIVWLAVYSITVGSFYWYLHSIELMSLPKVTVQPLPSNRGSLQSSLKIGRSRFGISYARVKIGRSYTGTVIFRHNASNNAGLLRAVSRDDSVSVRVQVMKTFEPNRGHKRPVISYYNVSYTYIPQLPAGSDTKTIDLMDLRGQVQNSICISAQKSNGYFPPDAWFPDIQRQRYDILAQGF